MLSLMSTSTSPRPLPPHSSPTDVTSVTTEEAFASLRGNWNQLAAASTSNSIFLTHEWFDAAWQWRRLDSRLEIIMVRAGGDTIGILPLVRGTTSIGATRTLRLLTVPDTQLSDMIGAAPERERVANAVPAGLAKDRNWDLLELSFLLPEGAILQYLAPALRAQGMSLMEHDGGRNTFIELQGAWTDFYATRSRRLKKANNLAANRLKKAGAISIEHVRAGSMDEHDVAKALESAISISSRSWKRETGNSLDHPGPRAFITRLSELASKREWMSLWMMHLQGRPVAMEYQLVDNGSVHALRSDFDQGCEDVSPGSYLFRHLLESCFDGNHGRYYMGPGENPYKLRWTDQGVPLRRLIVYNRTSRGRAAWLRDAVIKPVLRRLRDRFRPRAASSAQAGAATAEAKDD